MNIDKALTSLFNGYNLMFEAIESLNASDEKRYYTIALKSLTDTLKDTAVNGNFAECLEVVEAAQSYDLNFLAKSETDRENILASQKNISQGKHHYEILENDPASYRRHAKGYVDRDRLAGDIPNDGMRKALKSHLGHLRSRYSLMLSQEETDFLDAQVELVAAMVRRYQRLQKTALHENFGSETEDFPR